MELGRCSNCRSFLMGTAARKLYNETSCSVEVQEDNICVHLCYKLLLQNYRS
jgi:hypothetical protein